MEEDEALFDKDWEDARTLKEEIEDQEFKFDTFDSNSFKGEALVSFLYAKDRDEILTRFQLEGALKNFGIGKAQEKLFFTANGISTRIKVEPAPEPQDIIWENFGLSQKARLARQIVSTILSYLILGIGFCLVLALKILNVIFFNIRKVLTLKKDKKEVNKHFLDL